MTPTTERWLPVVGWEGYYEVSDHGQVRSLDRVIHGRWGRQRCQGRLLTPGCRPRDGRRHVQLCRANSMTPRLVYRLVLEAFVGPCPEGMEGCHNDGDASNDRLSNLRWDTKSENQRDLVRHGTHRQARKTHCPQGHALVSPNLASSKSGYRNCLACSRARAYWSWASKRGQVLDRRVLGDSYYSEIMQGA